MKSVCCQGDLAIVPAVQGCEKKASWKGLCRLAWAAGTFPAVQVLWDFLQDLDEVSEVQVRWYHVLDSIRGPANASFG